MNRAAVRYAKAILSLAQEQQIATAVQKEMATIAATVEKSKDLKELLESPVVKAEIKKATLLEIFKDSSTITKGLFDILIKNKRIAALGQVAKQYSVLFDALNNTQVATVTTAVEVTDALRAKLLDKVKELTGNEAILKNIIDESIIGGFILRVGDLQYNASIANQLGNLKRELSNPANISKN